MKSVFAPSLARTVKFGRRVPVARGQAFSFARYADKLPAPPATCDYATAATLAALRSIYGNDTLGDCVIAGGYHDVGVWTGNAGNLFVATQAQIIKDYSAIGGYVPGDEDTDNGCDEETALNYWVQHGFQNGTKLAGWLRVDATNQTEVMQALWLFENLYFGMCLPDKWIDPMPSKDGFIWDVAGKADPNNGHCVVGVGYNQTGVKIDTWGLFGFVTWSAVSTYASQHDNGELYLLLSPDQIAKASGKSPNGFDWATLVADFNAMGGNITPVNPPPPTTSAAVSVTVGGHTYSGSIPMTA